ncbi:MAG TPA: FliG C-terminal domain-containing protein [Lachnospiraceae bacterium]|nr:FliG C-terminal domain-containing protein [Lachnospiraceae bacterium]
MLNKEIAKLLRSKDILTAVTTLYKTQGLQNINNFHIIKEMVTIFTFEDISLLPDDTIRKWLSLCDDDELCIALVDSGNYLKSKILNNMSEERAWRLKKMMDSQDAVSLDQEYLAMNHLLEILQKTEEDNKITLERF